jgi:predicted phage baseplate assembly protein
VRVVDERGEWTPVRDLLGSGPFSRDLVVEVEDDESATLRFGDGRAGMRPDPGARLVARWRLGYGPAGNVGPDALAHLVAATPAEFASWNLRVSGVRNPVGAAGGAAREAPERTRMAAPEHFRTQARAITAQDWATAAGGAPGVLHATAELRWAGTWPTAFVSVQRAGGAEVDDGYVARVTAWLEQLRPAGHALSVRGPVWAPLDVLLHVRVEEHRFRRTVQAELAAALGDGLLPGGTPGFFHPDRWSFGEAVYLAPVLAAAMGVGGVVDVRAARFRRMDAAEGAPAVGDPIAVGAREVARATTSASAGAQYGRVAFRLVGGV